MTILPKLVCLMLLAGAVIGPCYSEDFGISTRAFDGEGFHAVFTFRHDILIHEATVFEQGGWVERLYGDGREIFLRTGASSHYRGVAGVHIVDGGKRIYAGGEAYDLGEDGFCHIIADSQSPSRVSVVNDPVFSTHQLDQEREKYLDQAKNRK